MPVDATAESKGRADGGKDDTISEAVLGLEVVLGRVVQTSSIAFIDLLPSCRFTTVPFGIISLPHINRESEYGVVLAVNFVKVLNGV